MLLNKEQKLRSKKLTAGVVITALAGFLYYLIVRYAGIGIPCLFSNATGLYCPGCGVTSMCVAMIRFDFVKAFGHNPALFLSLTVLFVVFAAMGFRYVKYGTGKLLLWQNVCIWIVIAVLLVYCVWRNMQMFVM